MIIHELKNMAKTCWRVWIAEKVDFVNIYISYFGNITFQIEFYIVKRKGQYLKHCALCFCHLLLLSLFLSMM